MSEEEYMKLYGQLFTIKHDEKTDKHSKWLSIKFLSVFFIILFLLVLIFSVKLD